MVRWRAASAFVVLLLSCSDTDEFVDRNRPPTFMHDCARDEDCAAPFECLDVQPDSPRRLCTLACTTTDECPAWTATGHCAGRAQSQCHDERCQYGCK